jgi:hypothetical protein
MKNSLLVLISTSLLKIVSLSSSTISQEETKTIGLIFLDSIKMLEVDNLLELVIIEILINRAMPWPYRENYMLSRAITFFFFKSKVSDKEKYLSERE